MDDEVPAALRRAAEQAIDEAGVLDALAALGAEPSPYGRERATARRLADWAAARWPELSWRVDPLAATAALPDSANLVGSSALGTAPELLVYSHLDTSLTGGADFDAPITGRDAPAPELRRPDGADAEPVVSGFGLGVARAATAAALVGFAAAAGACRAAGRPHRLTLLLAAAGTHRTDPDAGPTPGGVAHHLDRHPLPAAAVVAKSGPPGVLTAEPGAMFLRVRLTSRFHPALFRDAAVPPGGLLAHLGRVVAALEAFRAAHLAGRAGRGGQVGAEVGIGAVRAGQPGKPDLLPGRLDFHLYLVTVPGDEPAEIADALAATLTEKLRGTPLGDCGVSVTGWPVHPAAATDPDAPICHWADAAWRAAHGHAPQPIRGWTGSTDGVVLRGRGVPTVRLGPPSLPADPGDPRGDRFAVAELVRFARIYADIALRSRQISTA
ncbi:hypothetical protein O7628_25645 [Micromonospora sp. WMMD956]|uniref:hypothetical protein n=1 Tax=Micromonospora sp. WMMD956 TaxID=3016108 RepID=UPI0024177E7A|nr:hypothetical protein [Micromonospora sp. WMMD956]MDG4818879.1 hypothetical protein [Micromonospora sp. WMMD956]